MTTDGQTNTQSALITCFYCSFILAKMEKIEICLIFDDFGNDVITSLIDVNFLYFYNQQKSMIIGFNLICNFNLYWLKQKFSRGYKLLHVFWNTLYVHYCSMNSYQCNSWSRLSMNWVGSKFKWHNLESTFLV